MKYSQLAIAAFVLATAGANANTFDSGKKSVADFRAYPLLIPATGNPAPYAEKPSSGTQIVRFAGEYYAAVIPVDVKAGQEFLTSCSVQRQETEIWKVLLTPGQGSVRVDLNGVELGSYLYEGYAKPTFAPIYAPGQTMLTRSLTPTEPDELVDHPHQRGMWFMHGNVNNVDFWNEKGKFGKIVQTSIKTTSSDVVGQIVTTNDWVNAEGKKFCEDERSLLFWNPYQFGTPASLAPRIMDFSVVVKATEGEVVFGDTKEGSFGIRLPKWMTLRHNKGKMLNSEGLKDGEVWGKQAKWVRYWGTNSENKTIGVGVIEYPENFRYPTYWHARDYGLFAANPFGIGDFTGDNTKDGKVVLKPGETLTLRYRIIVHRGDGSDVNFDAFSRQLEALKNP